MLLLIHSAKQIVTVTDDRTPSLRGIYQRTPKVMEDTRGLAIVVDNDGNIADIGVNSYILNKYKDFKPKEVIDAKGKCLLPGFIDAHTHPIWAGDRVHEFIMKLEGKSYLEIHEAGGGIYFTVENTIKASDDDLYERLKERLAKMLKSGTTLVECKSGYGLDMDQEIRLLKLLNKAKRELPIDISITYCGAHAIPEGKTSEEATESIVNHHIPSIKGLMMKNQLHVDNIDVFCDKGLFNTEQSYRILKAGKDAGMKLNFHGDELYPMKSAEMGSSLGATAISHLEEISEEGIRSMAKENTVAVLLPSTVHTLRLNPPPARRIIDAGVAVALGSDFNPNAFTYSMPLIMNLACIYLKMTTSEALVAATINAAASLGLASSYGSIEVSKTADIVIVEASRWEHIIYQLGCHSDIITHVIKRGKIVHQRS